MSFYGKLAESSLKLIESKGMALVVSKAETGVFDPTTGRYTSTTAGESNTVQGVVVPLTKVEDNRFMQDLVEGKLRKVVVAAKGMTFEPQSGCRVNDGTYDYEVISSVPVNPAGTPIIHIMQVRRAGE